jgi:hypothetical protein
MGTCRITGCNEQRHVICEIPAEETILILSGGKNGEGIPDTIFLPDRNLKDSDQIHSGT